MLKNKKGFIFLLLVIIAGFLFYWFQIRPSKIRSDCGFEPVALYNKNETAMSYQEFYDFYYQKCLNQHGLK